MALRAHRAPSPLTLLPEDLAICIRNYPVCNPSIVGTKLLQRPFNDYPDSFPGETKLLGYLLWGHALLVLGDVKGTGLLHAPGGHGAVAANPPARQHVKVEVVPAPHPWARPWAFSAVGSALRAKVLSCHTLCLHAGVGVVNQLFQNGHPHAWWATDSCVAPGARRHRAQERPRAGRCVGQG